MRTQAGKKPPAYVLFASYGNDSAALIHWAYKRGLGNLVVAYSDTGWAHPTWPERVTQAETWVKSLGFQHARIKSEGMLSLVERKKAWPRGGGGKFQFCTQELKQKPALAWLDEVDPEKEATCMIGVRRVESPNRAQFPEFIESSVNHGGRSLWAPLVRHGDLDRDCLLMGTPFTPLPHRSRECWPCVNARKGEIAALSEERIGTIREAEYRAGTNSKGNQRVMFSPKRSAGAVGIDQVVEWARGDRGEDSQLSSCESGWCDS